MADGQGAWSEPVPQEEPAGIAAESGGGLDGELELLEERVAAAAAILLELRRERTALDAERSSLLQERDDLRRECEALHRAEDALRREREETAARLTRIIAKVDALRGEP